MGQLNLAAIDRVALPRKTLGNVFDRDRAKHLIVLAYLSLDREGDSGNLLRVRFNLELLLLCPFSCHTLAMLERFDIPVIGDDCLVAGKQEVPRKSIFDINERSEERRVGKECRCRWSPYHVKKKMR